MARTGLPYVGSVGALDMVNFRGFDTVPESYRDRNLYRHNPQVTLMRTTAEENRQMGEWIAERLNRCEGEVRFLIPEKRRLGASTRRDSRSTILKPMPRCSTRWSAPCGRPDRRRLIRLPHHINDPEFSAALVENFRAIAA